MKNETEAASATRPFHVSLLSYHFAFYFSLYTRVRSLFVLHSSSICLMFYPRFSKTQYDLRDMEQRNQLNRIIRLFVTQNFSIFYHKIAQSTHTRAHTRAFFPILFLFAIA